MSTSLKNKQNVHRAANFSQANYMRVRENNIIPARVARKSKLDPKYLRPEKTQAVPPKTNDSKQ